MEDSIDRKIIFCIGVHFRNPKF